MVVKTKSDSEILTHYMLEAGMGPEHDELRKGVSESWGFAAHALGVRAAELKQAINDALNKAFPPN